MSSVYEGPQEQVEQASVDASESTSNKRDSGSPAPAPPVVSVLPKAGGMPSWVFVPIAVFVIAVGLVLRRMR